jgi:hypothetical protein
MERYDRPKTWKNARTGKRNSQNQTQNSGINLILVISVG